MLDYEAEKNTYTLVVTAADPSGASDAVTVTVMVTDVDLGSVGNRYDFDKNEVIDRDEAIAAVIDYFDYLITKDEALEVINLYFSN